MVSTPSRSRVRALPWVALMVAGLALAAATAITKFTDEAKKDALRAQGVHVPAVVVESAAGGRQVPDRSLIGYEYAGRTYTAWVKGHPGTGVWVEAGDPTEFVTELGSTDDSLAFFNTWAGMPWGAAVAALGAVAWRRAIRR